MTHTAWYSRALGLVGLVLLSAAVGVAAGCRGANDDHTPEGGFQAFVEAVRSENAQAVFKRLSPSSKAYLTARARRASEQSGKSPGFEPWDMLADGVMRVKWDIAEVKVVSSKPDRAILEVVSKSGKSERVTMDRTGTRWYVQLPVISARVRLRDFGTRPMGQPPDPAQPAPAAVAEPKGEPKAEPKGEPKAEPKGEPKAESKGEFKGVPAPTEAGASGGGAGEPKPQGH